MSEDKHFMLPDKLDKVGLEIAEWILRFYALDRPAQRYVATKLKQLVYSTRKDI